MSGCRELPLAQDTLAGGLRSSTAGTLSVTLLITIPVNRKVEETFVADAHWTEMRLALLPSLSFHI